MNILCRMTLTINWWVRIMNCENGWSLVCASELNDCAPMFSFFDEHSSAAYSTMLAGLLSCVVCMCVCMCVMVYSSCVCYKTDDRCWRTPLRGRIKRLWSFEILFTLQTCSTLTESCNDDVITMYAPGGAVGKLCAHFLEERPREWILKNGSCVLCTHKSIMDCLAKSCTFCWVNAQ